MAPVCVSSLASDSASKIRTLFRVSRRYVDHALYQVYDVWFDFVPKQIQHVLAKKTRSSRDVC